MEPPRQILPYIEGTKFGELIQLKIEPGEKIPDRVDFVREIIYGKKSNSCWVPRSFA